MEGRLTQQRSIEKSLKILKVPTGTLKIFRYLTALIPLVAVLSSSTSNSIRMFPNIIILDDLWLFLLVT